MAIRFAVEGDLRFISHHDMMRLFERALSRAQLPVRFSEGFNPRPRMSMPLPRPVGVATTSDVLVVELSAPVPALEVLARLRQQSPAGLTLHDAWDPGPDRKLHAERVDYEVAFPTTQTDAVRAAVERLLSCDQWMVQRAGTRGRKGRDIDLRSMLIEASTEPGLLRWACRVSDSGSARPAEWLQAFGLIPSESLHHIRRTAVRWIAHKPGASSPAEPTSPEDAEATDPA